MDIVTPFTKLRSMSSFSTDRNDTFWPLKLPTTLSMYSPYSPSSPASAWLNSYFSINSPTDSDPDLDDLQITLQDNTETDSESSDGLWAKAVSIASYSIVGNKAASGSYVVWNVTVHTLEGGPMVIRKRYSEFDALRQHLIQTFPNAFVALPPLPRKSVVSRFRPLFLERRRQGLIYFLNCVLLNPEFAGSAVLKDFLFY